MMQQGVVTTQLRLASPAAELCSVQQCAVAMFSFCRDCALCRLHWHV
jgi:hypothetical protein